MVQRFESPGAFGGPQFAVHVQGEPLFQVPQTPLSFEDVQRQLQDWEKPLQPE